MTRRIFPALVLVLCLLLPVFAGAAEPRTEAHYQMNTLPDCWSPLEEATPETELIRWLTADSLYRLTDDGSGVIPSLAADMPLDVTWSYIGTFGIPANAQRGYAFHVELDENARWEDGTSVTADDFLFTMSILIEEGSLPVNLANLEGFYAGDEVATEDVISLMDAGFSSVEEAREAGHTAFYVDVSHFWGLDSGWVSVTDNTRLQDAAIPSGVTERYVSGAYLYDRYLRTGAGQSFFQTEFVGISAEPRFLDLENVGMLRVSESGFVVILQEPTTPSALALKLMELPLLRADLFDSDFATSPATYSATGPYRIVSVADGEMVLEPNPFWLGKTEAPSAERIRLQLHIGT